MPSLKRLTRLAWYPLVAPALVVVGSLVHGGAVAAAVLLGGGTVDDIDFTFYRVAPVLFGNFTYYPGPTQSLWTIMLAPVALWIWAAAAGALVVERLRPGRAARLVAIFGCILPSLAISAALALAVLHHPMNNYFDVVWEQPVATAFGAVVILGVLGVLGHRAVRRAWASSLSGVEHAALHVGLVGLPWVLLMVSGR